MRELKYYEAICEGQAQALDGDERVYLMGQGVDNPWCVGKTTHGLLPKYGSTRVRDVPISENAMTGAAIGSAMAGMRPIVFHPRMDFMYLAMDQIINHCAHWHYMFGGQVSVPVTIRGIINRGGEQGAQHSQSPYSMYAHVPGLKIVVPSTAYDAKGLFLAAVADDDPVLYIDDRWLYDDVGGVPVEPYKVPIGKGHVRREGTDVTIVGISYLAERAVRAAKDLKSQHKIDVEVVDPRTIKPLDKDIILESVSKTGRLVVADPAWPTCSIASEISSFVLNKLMKKMKAPVEFVTLPDAPAPASARLENVYYPDEKSIMEAVLRMFS